MCIRDSIWTTFARCLDHFLDESETTLVDHPVRRGRSKNIITIPHRGTSKTIPKTLKKLLRGREIKARNARQQPKHASKNDRKYEQKRKTKSISYSTSFASFPDRKTIVWPRSRRASGGSVTSRVTHRVTHRVPQIAHGAGHRVTNRVPLREWIQKFMKKKCRPPAIEIITKV